MPESVNPTDPPTNPSTASKRPSSPDRPRPITLATALTLPCGATLPNRIAKAAMSEQLGELRGAPTPTLTRLYSAWGRGGAGLLITGNVMIDRRAYVEPRNVVLDGDDRLETFGNWARAGSAHGSAMLMQINHPGRVATAPLYRRPIGPSALRPQAPGFNLRTPRAMTAQQIADVRRRFARTAELAVAAGFAGVQIHAAHGYLLSQFLSPVANNRTDRYGGSAQNRRRLVLEIVADVRQAVGDDAIVSVKLNSQDFQRGGLDIREWTDVASALADAGVDLIEISGGNYEPPAMTGVTGDSSRRSEAYFLDYAEKLRSRTRVPLMLTGGIRSRAFMESVLADGAVDVLGIGRPFAVEPGIAAALLAGDDPARGHPVAPQIPLRAMSPINSYLQLAWHARNFRLLADGAETAHGRGVVATLLSAATTVSARALTQP